MAYKCLCTCHKIPLCKYCSDCYLGHGITLRQWINEGLREKVKKGKKKSE